MKKSKKKEFLRASNVKDYLRNKFDLNCDEFWTWLFVECPIGESSLLSMNLKECANASWLEYIRTIKEEFYDSKEDEFDEYVLEIENDL